jgi:uncharacterized protein (TIGR02284 family)
MTTQYDILLTALNELIEINHSRINGYTKAADDIDGGDLKGLFQGMVNESEHFADDLAAHVEKFGGEPVSGSTFTGKIHQAWLDFKAAVSSNNRETILSSCEFGDETAIKAYDTALALDKVQASPDFMSLLHSQRSSISESLKVIQSLRNSEHDAKSEQDVLSTQDKY